MAVQMRRVKFCKHSISGTYMQKCLLKGYLEDTPRIDTLIQEKRWQEIYLDLPWQVHQLNSKRN